MTKRQLCKTSPPSLTISDSIPSIPANQSYRSASCSLCSSSLSTGQTKPTTGNLLVRRRAHNTKCQHSGCNGTASLACHEPLLPMLLKSFCNRLTRQALVTCCAADRAAAIVGHSRISSRNSNSKTNVSSKPGLLSRRRHKKVAKLTVVRSASTDLVCSTSRGAQKHFVHTCDYDPAVHDCSQLACLRLLPQRLYSPASGSTKRLRLISAATCSDC